MALIAALLAGGWSWYFNLHRYSWDESRKKQYWEEHINATALREERFRAAVDMIEIKRKEHEAGRQVSQDLFRLP